MKLVTIDIETLPSITYTWGLHNQNHALNQLIIPHSVAGVGWKWHHERQTNFIRGDYTRGLEPQDQAFMLTTLWEILNEADAVVHYNGVSFDIPHLQREMATKLGLTPPSPFKQIDLLKTARRQFRFVSNKLDHVAQEFQVGAKLKHEGFDLWIKCMEGDEAAWKRMERYCKQDVRITEKLYDRILPWIQNHPNAALFVGGGDSRVCTQCGSTKVQSRGSATTAGSTYPRYWCAACGKWMRGKSRTSGVELWGL